MTDEAERFTAIYDACRQRVWAYATSHAGRQVADEVVSETFAIAWRRLADVPEPPLPWLLGVARNVLRDSYRATARRESFAAEQRRWLAQVSGEVGDVGEEVTERLAMLHALAALAEDDRETLILVAWQGLTPREAARVVGCSPAALRVRLHRARKRLAHAVESAGATGAAEPDGAAEFAGATESATESAGATDEGPVRAVRSRVRITGEGAS